MEQPESVMQQEFKGRKELCDERFKRDNTRIGRLETNLEKLTALVTKTAEIQSANIKDTGDNEDRIKKVETNLEALTVLVTKVAEIQNSAAKDTEDHENRLRAIEAKGGKWFDTIIAAALGALVAGVIAYLLAAAK